MESETKRNILKAANRLIETQGFEACTLANVAKEASMSKGGLLYHFPTKDALIAGLIEHHLQEVDRFIAGIEADASSPEDGMRRVLGWFIERIGTIQKMEKNYGIIAALERNPEFIAPVRTYERALAARIRESFDEPGPIFTVKLALDGLLYGCMLGTAVLEKEDLADVRAFLSGLIHRTEEVKTEEER